MESKSNQLSFSLQKNLSEFVQIHLTFEENFKSVPVASEAFINIFTD
jgi:hypothetical protein